MWPCLKRLRQRYVLVNCSFVSRTYLPKWFPHHGDSNHRFTMCVYLHPELSRQGFYTLRGNKTLLTLKTLSCLRRNIPIVMKCLAASVWRTLYQDQVDWRFSSSLANCISLFQPTTSSHSSVFLPLQSLTNFIIWPPWSNVTQIWQTGISQVLQKYFSSSLLWSSYRQKVGRFITSS